MDEEWIGRAVSIECEEKLGVFQGVIKHISEAFITIVRAFRNGVPLRKQDAEITLQSTDILKIFFIPSCNAQKTMTPTVINKPTPVKQPNFSAMPMPMPLPLPMSMPMPLSMPMPMPMPMSLPIPIAMSMPMPLNMMPSDGMQQDALQPNVLQQDALQPNDEQQDLNQSLLAGTAAAALTNNLSDMQKYYSEIRAPTTPSWLTNGNEQNGDQPQLATSPVMSSPSVAEFFSNLIPPKVEVRLPNDCPSASTSTSSNADSYGSSASSKPLELMDPLNNGSSSSYNGSSTNGNGHEHGHANGPGPGPVVVFGNGYGAGYSNGAALGFGNGNVNGYVNGFGNGNVLGYGSTNALGFGNVSGSGNGSGSGSGVCTNNQMRMPVRGNFNPNIPAWNARSANVTTTAGPAAAAAAVTAVAAVAAAAAAPPPPNGNGNGNSGNSSNGNGHGHGNGNGRKQSRRMLRRENSIRESQTFSTSVDDPILNEDFDFEGNLALFDKQAIWENIEAKQKPIEVVPEKYRHDENILTGKPLELRQIESLFDGTSDFVTDEGLIIPTIPTYVRYKIECTAEKGGLSFQRQIDLLARGATDLAILLLGGARRLTPANCHQWPQIAIICDKSNNFRASNIGAATGRQLASHGVKVLLYLEEDPNIEQKSIEISLFKATGNTIVYSVDELPTPDLVIISTNSATMSDSVKKWLGENRASVFAIDPPPSGVTDVSIKYAILPILPLNGISSNRCGKLYLCNLGIPDKFFRDAGIKYKSPFGHKFVIPIHSKD